MRKRMQEGRAGRLRVGMLTCGAGASLVLASLASSEPLMSPPVEYTPSIADVSTPLNESDQPGADELNPADIARMMAARASGGNRGGSNKPDFPPFKEVAQGYEKVVSTADGQSFYNVWVREKDGQMLAELPRGYERKMQFIALTLGSGDTYAGLQAGDMYAKWKRYDNRLALIQPNLAVRSSGEPESKGSVERLFTDRVILDVPIVTMGPNGQPVIDADALLLGQAGRFFGAQARGLNSNLATIAKAKAFPQNVELAFEAPVAGGQLRSFHYSISEIPENTGYRPREADARVGYFTTVYRDLGKIDNQDKWVRYANRWHLEKRDSSLEVSPPKQPIVFYVDHAAPVRYRRWIRRGVEYWNKAFEQVGIDGAIEVRFQDAQTGAHMEKDPEDVRYNFIRWLANDQGTAIGPSRVHPKTGQILDADIILTDGFIRSYYIQYTEYLPEVATETFGPDTLAWLERNPDWDPRLRLVDEAERQSLVAQRQSRGVLRYGGHASGQADPTLIGDDQYDGLAGRLSQTNGLCMVGRGKSVQIAMFNMHREITDSLMKELTTEQPEIPDDVPPEVLEMLRKRIKENPEMLDHLPEELKAKLGYGPEDQDEQEGETDDESKSEDEKKDGKGKGKTDKPTIDGMPEEFVGPMLADVVSHEVGHTLGLRHNFRASSVYSLDEMNSEDFKGNKTITGSVMDYTGINIRMETGETQGDYTMIDIGPYDMWAIRYGYTFDDPKEILKEVNNPEHTYATDEDTWGPDPYAARWDLGADPLNYAKEFVRLASFHRERILTDFVKDGESWARARRGYELTLGLQTRMLGIMSRWIGGSYVLRDKKGDPGDRTPVTPVEPEKQRDALRFVIDNSFYDEAFGLNADLLRHLTNDRWWDAGGFGQIYQDPAWPVHDRIMGIQASALTMLMNPQSLTRVFDNEIRSGGLHDDPITVPEVMESVHAAVWEELDSPTNGRYTATSPMISSLRRNLQREHMERLIDLSMQGGSGSAAMNAISNLATMQLRELHSRIDSLVSGQHARSIDAYSKAHLGEAKIRIEKALEAQYIYNAGDMAGGGVTNIFLQPTQGGQPEQR